MRSPLPSRSHATRAARAAVLAFVAVAAALAGSAPRGPAIAEDLPKDPHNWCPIGGIDAQGDIVGFKKVQDLEIHKHIANKKSKGNVIRVREVTAGGIADIAGLKVGDMIYEVNGTPFKYRRDEIRALGLAIEDAEGKGGQIKLTVIREGLSDKGEKRLELVDIKPSLPALGAYAKTTVFDCEKVENVRKRALAEVAKLQDSSSGAFLSKLGGNNGHVVMTSLCALALMGAMKGEVPPAAVTGESPDGKPPAADDPRGPYWREVEKAAAYVVATGGDEGPRWNDKPGGPNWSQVNWQLGYAGVFLCEYEARFPTEAVRTKLVELNGMLAKNMEASGGYAHGPGGPNALNYVEVAIVSNFAIASMGMTKGLGLPINEETLTKAKAYMDLCGASGGGVGYSHSNRTGGDPGRTAGTAYALMQCFDKSPSAQRCLKGFQNGIEELHDGHVSPVMHILAGALASARSGKAALKEFADVWRPYIMASRLPDGTFDGRPTAESRQMGRNTDKQMGPTWTTSSYCLVLSLGKGRYKMLEGFEEPKPEKDKK